MQTFKKKFKDWDSAEDWLVRFLGDDYDTDRQEYYIEECEIRNR